MTVNTKEAKSTLARAADGTIQITFTIAFATVKSEREKALIELSEEVSVPGFRKGKAPLEKVSENVNPNKLLEHTLSHILPTLLGTVIKEHNLKLIVYPKFELINAKEDTDWQVMATTCEAPLVTLGDYKKALTGLSTGEAIWTPDKGDPTKNSKKPKSREEKEQLILKTLLDTCKVTIPSILINEEVNNRLSNLLSRIEKLGLSLDSYLASIGKTAELLREEYTKQSQEGLSLDFILNEIAVKEKILIEKAEIDSSIKALSQDPSLKESPDTEERRRFIEAVLKRRKALDFLLTL